MNDKKFDISAMFNEPDFQVDPQKYIEKLKNLLSEANKEIDALNENANKAQGMDKIFQLSIIVFNEYQRDIIQQLINTITFYTR